MASMTRNCAAGLLLLALAAAVTADQPPLPLAGESYLDAAYKRLVSYGEATSGDKADGIMANARALVDQFMEEFQAKALPEGVTTQHLAEEYTKSANALLVPVLQSAKASVEQATVRLRESAPIIVKLRAFVESKRGVIWAYVAAMLERAKKARLDDTLSDVREGLSALTVSAFGFLKEVKEIANAHPHAPAHAHPHAH